MNSRKCFHISSIAILFIYLSIKLHVTSSNPLPKVDLFTLSIIHWNDFHARFDEINTSGYHCRPSDRPNCFGGYARLVTTVKRLQAERQHPIFLNGGDNFQGTFWYSVGKWNVTAQFLNMLPADAIVSDRHIISIIDHILVNGILSSRQSATTSLTMASVDWCHLSRHLTHRSCWLT